MDKALQDVLGLYWSEEAGCWSCHFIDNWKDKPAWAHKKSLREVSAAEIMRTLSAAKETEAWDFGYEWGQIDEQDRDKGSVTVLWESDNK